MHLCWADLQRIVKWRKVFHVLVICSQLSIGWCDVYSRSCVSRSFDISTGICAGQKYGISVCQFGDFEPPKLQTFENKIVKVSSFSESNCTDPVDAACKSYFSESKVKLSPFLFLESVGLKSYFPGSLRSDLP